MSDDFDLISIMRELMVEHGQRRTSRTTGISYVGISNKARQPFFRDLVTEVKNAGQPKTYFIPPIKRLIVEEITAKGKNINQTGTKLWKEISTRDLEHTIVEVYGRDKSTVTQPKNIESVNSSQAKYVDDLGEEIIFKEHDPSKYSDMPSVSRELDEEMAEILNLREKK